MRRDGRLRNTNRFNAMENKEVVNRNSAESDALLLYDSLLRIGSL